MAFEDMGDELIPSEEDSTIRLPVTFDYNGGRSDNLKSNLITAAILTGVMLLFTIGSAMNSSLSIWLRVLIPIAVVLVYIYVIRMFILHEKTYSNAYETLKEEDWCPPVSTFWNIYEIDYVYPYICHFRNGVRGIFVKLEKDVIIGKEDSAMFRHYDAISDAYNAASRLKINMCHIDYMDNIGNDPRLRSLYNDANQCDNPELRDVMLSILGNLQDEMSMEYTSYDVYLFTSVGRGEDLWAGVQEIISYLLDGNFITYKVLNIDGIRSTAMALFNLKDFSAINACDSIFRGQSLRGIVPIEISRGDGSIEKLNKTQEELRIEAEERAAEERRKYEEEQELKRQKKRGGKKPSSNQKKGKDVNLMDSKTVTKSADNVDSTQQEAQGGTQIDSDLPEIFDTDVQKQLDSDGEYDLFN